MGDFVHRIISLGGGGVGGRGGVYSNYHKF